MAYFVEMRVFWKEIFTAQGLGFLTYLFIGMPLIWSQLAEKGWSAMEVFLFAPLFVILALLLSLYLILLLTLEPEDDHSH